MITTTRHSNDDGVRAKYRFECSGCRKFHEELCHTNDFMRRWQSWEYKHSLPTCEIRPIKLWHRIPRDFSEAGYIKRAMARLGNMFLNWELPWYLRTWDYAENNN